MPNSVRPCLQSSSSSKRLRSIAPYKFILVTILLFFERSVIANWRYIVSNNEVAKVSTSSEASTASRSRGRDNIVVCTVGTVSATRRILLASILFESILFIEFLVLAIDLLTLRSKVS